MPMEPIWMSPSSVFRMTQSFVGGKRRLGKLLARHIEAVPHETYAEPFVGMGGVFFPPALGAAARGDQRHLTRCCDAVSHPAASLSAVHGDAEVSDHVARGVRAPGGF